MGLLKGRKDARVEARPLRERGVISSSRPPRSREHRHAQVRCERLMCTTRLSYFSHTSTCTSTEQHITSVWRRLILVQHKYARVTGDILVGQPMEGPCP